MIRQYIKLFLESNISDKKKPLTFSQVLKNTSDELDISNNNNNDNQSLDNEENEENIVNNDNTRLNTDATGMAWLLRNNR